MTDQAVREAVLAWMVEGAKKWYAMDRVVPIPEKVRSWTEDWRMENDASWGYANERLVFDHESHVMAVDLLADLNEWLKTHGHLPWSMKTMVSRLGEHEVMKAHGVERKVGQRLNDGLSRPPAKPTYVPGTDQRVIAVGVGGNPPPRQYSAWIGVRFARDSDEES